MGNVNLFLRDPNGAKPTPIYLDIRYAKNTLRLVYPTGEKIEPAMWDKEKQRPMNKGVYRSQPEFKLRLDNVIRMSKEILRSYLNDNNQKYPSVEELRALFNERLKNQKKDTEKKIDLLSFIDKFISKSTQRVNEKTGKPLSEWTLKRYITVKNKLIDFSKANAKYKTIDFDTINLDFYYDFIENLKEQGYSTNYIAAIIKELKVFLNEATEQGINKNTAFRSSRFKKVTEEVDSIYLSVAELKQLHALDLSQKPRLEKVRDLMLVGCWTGLRFSDFSRLLPKNLVKYQNEMYIEIETSKTSECVVIPVHPIVKSIINKYDGITPNSLPPAISNQRMNNYLKELGEIAGFDDIISVSKTQGGKRTTKSVPKHQLMTTHTARRSFATNSYIMGVPTYDIMRVTGHRTETAFLKYIKMTPKDSARNMSKIWSELS